MKNYRQTRVSGETRGREGASNTGAASARAAAIAAVVRFLAARLVLLIAALVPALPVLAAAPAHAKTTPQGLAGWVEGPARYLLSRDEEREFRKLPDDLARALFIVRFWHRRDPTPDTLENETRRDFYRRVAEANRRFKDSVRPGWMTDRGRIFILLGEPDQEQVNEGGGTEGGVLRWIYRNRLNKKSDPERVFAFARDPSGEWRLSLNPNKYSDVSSGLATSGADPSFGGLRLRTAALASVPIAVQGATLPIISGPTLPIISGPTLPIISEPGPLPPPRDG